jgi:hypothetical protein
MRRDEQAGLVRPPLWHRRVRREDVCHSSHFLACFCSWAFTLRVYTHAIKRRERLSGAELGEFNRALEWAQWAQVATNDAIGVAPAPAVAESENKETRYLQRVS